MLLSEYIKVLEEFLNNNEDLPVTMTQSGYYAEDSFADLYDVPEIKTVNSYVDFKKKDMGQFIVLGHSNQSY